MKDIRHKLLGALFCEGQKKGIDAETLRNDVAVLVLKKRLSDASNQEIIKLLEHITGSKRKSSYRFESSRDGLIKELESIATLRWGEDFEKALNALVNANRKILTHYRFLSIASLKAVKQVIQRLQGQGKAR